MESFLHSLSRFSCLLEEFKVWEPAMLPARGLPSMTASRPWAARAGVLGKAAQTEVSTRGGSDDRRCRGGKRPKVRATDRHGRSRPEVKAMSP